MKVTLFVLLVFLGLSTSVLSQNDAGKKYDSKIMEVAQNIYLLQGRGGNIGFIIGSDGVLMIDDQFADISEGILKDISRFSKLPVEFVINTHHHGDHTGGNHNMAVQGAIIVSQSNARDHLVKVKNESEAKGIKIGSEMLPVVTFQNSIKFFFNNEEIIITHIPKAHTNGDAIVHFKKGNVIHTGDIFFNGKYPYIDLEHGGSLQGYIDGLSMIQDYANDDTKIIPGHGDVATVREVKYLQDMLQNLYKLVSFHYMKGKTEEQILAMTELTRSYDEQGYGDGYITTEQMLRTIYKEVDKELTEEKLQRERDLQDIRDYQEKNKG